MFFEETMIAMILDDPCVVMSYPMVHHLMMGQVVQLPIFLW
jgi:hypothetical protein